MPPFSNIAFLLSRTFATPIRRLALLAYLQRLIWNIWMPLMAPMYLSFFGPKWAHLVGLPQSRTNDQYFWARFSRNGDRIRCADASTWKVDTNKEATEYVVYYRKLLEKTCVEAAFCVQGCQMMHTPTSKDRLNPQLDCSPGIDLTRKFVRISEPPSLYTAWESVVGS